MGQIKISGLTIRKAQHSDIERLIELLKVLFTLEEDFVFNAEKQRRGLQMMLQNQENRCILVAELNHQIVGMVSGQTLISTAEGGISVLVEDVVLDSNYRRQGIGTKLLSAVEEWAVEIGAVRMQLLADINNTLALAFYQQLNWNNTSLVCLQKKDIQS